MKRFGRLWLLLACLAAVQAIVGFVMLLWAFPLFADQPLLANGVSHRASELEALIKASAHPSPRLAGMAEHYRWLFWRQIEGIEASLLGAATLLISSVVTWVALLVQPSARSLAREVA